MRRLVFYYSAILFPLLLCFYLMHIGYHWAWLLILYYIPYRVITDGLRLHRKGLIEREEFWKLIIPGWRLGYTRALYFEK